MGMAPVRVGRAIQPAGSGRHPSSAMARFSPKTRQRRPSGPHLLLWQARRQGTGPSAWALAALALLLLGGVLLLFNKEHSGDPLKIRRELRKF